MSNGFVTVAQCIEALPLGRFSWDLLLCAFLLWLFLGAVNESTPLAFAFVSSGARATENSAAAAAASMALGNGLAILVGGWLADAYGRMAVIRPALLMSLACGVALRLVHGFMAGLVARFLLGFASGGLLGVMMPLLAELLPSRHRGFYLTIWCAGWPFGALMAVLSGILLPGISWQSLDILALTPVMLLFLFTRFELMPESPRYMYLAGQREEGYNTLLDMYDKEDMLLPWAPESLAVTTSEAKVSGSGCDRMNTDAAVTLTLAATTFAFSSAAQSMKLWFPVMLVAHQADRAGLHSFKSSILTFASGPKSMSLLNIAGPHLLFVEPDIRVVFILAQGFAIQLIGVIACAFLSTKVSRRQMMLGSATAAFLLNSAALLVADSSSSMMLSGALLGGQLAAQATVLNFLQVFTCEHFPTATRAKTMALVMFAGQLGNFVIPVVGGVIVHRYSAATAVICFSLLSLLGLVGVAALPLSFSNDQTLLDVADPQRSQGRDRKLKNHAWVTYQTV